MHRAAPRSRRRPRDDSGGIGRVLRGLGVGAHDDRVGDRHDLVDRQVGLGGVLADRLRAAGLVTQNVPRLPSGSTST